MKVTFLSLRAREPLAFGIMSLAGVLRKKGHIFDVAFARTATEAAAQACLRDADVLAMSATTGLHRIYVSWARRLRAEFPDKAIILGGPHPTFFPEVIERAPFDAVCLGEAEESLPEFLDWWRSGGVGAPDGFWVRSDHGRGPIEKGKLRPPVRHLDSLPLPAYDIFYEADRKYRRLPIRVFMATRGCPYRCTYCFNRGLIERHRGLAPTVRVRDPDALVDEIQGVLRRWGGKLVWFLDANFTSKRKWLEAFLAVYRRRIGLPFFCKLRPERATERTAKLLADAGCTAVGIGIESGSERLRRSVLNRKVSDAEILAGCRQLKANGIRLLSFNMLGIPGESLDEALKTLAMNVACGVDYAGATILQPYPGTELSRWAVERGYFDGNFEKLRYSYFDASPLEFPGLRDRDRITNLQRIFALAVEFPLVRSRIRKLIDMPPSSLLDHVFKARHDWAMQHTFYRAFTRQQPIETATEDRLWTMCRELHIPAGFN